MTTSLPQTYLIILTSLLVILVIVVGRQFLKVRGDEIKLAKLEKSDAIKSNQSKDLYELGSAQLNKRLYPQATNTLKKALKNLNDEPDEAKAIIENALGFSLSAQDKFLEAVKHYENAIKCKVKYSVAINNLAFAKLKLLKENEAYNLYQEVLTFDPNNKTANKQIKKINKRNPKNFQIDNENKGF
ncbi:hypothetical protein [Prochlorococcus marinus]|uniref:hypothetical protein n=1 Tax=Prochlorococcus marinus TaxID=1219 RepID=UPI0022B4CFCE|nr:hypothetical protein [Prochlorococcus marinus]